MTVRNHSANPVGATVRLHLDPGFSYVSSSAPPVPSTIRTSTLQWEISAIPPMGVYEMTVDLDADKTVVGAGKYMKVRGEVIQRDHSRPGTVVAPPPEVVTPEPEPPAPTENTTGGSSGGSYGGLPSGIPADGVKLSYYVGRRINTLDGFIGFEDMESPYVFGGENTWLVLGIENHTGKEVKDLYLVINQPREGNYLTDALRKGSQPGEMPNNAKIDEKGRTVRHFPSIPPVENGVVEYENKATLSVYFEPLKSRSNVLISAHVISENKDNPIQKTLTISTSVAP